MFTNLKLMFYVNPLSSFVVVYFKIYAIKTIYGFQIKKFKLNKKVFGNFPTKYLRNLI